MNQLTEGREDQRPIPVEVYQPAPGPFAIVQTIAGTALSPLETTFIVVVFVIFILLQREDLRNRFIRLAGSSDLQRTTLAMNDAAGRLSRFFLVQTLVNASFGVIVAVGLYFIGLPSPILWGIVAFLLRFVPYIGPIAAAGFPVALAAALDPGHCALGGVPDQGPSLFERTIRRMKAGIDELEEANIILRRLHHDGEGQPGVRARRATLHRQQGGEP